MNLSERQLRKIFEDRFGVVAADRRGRLSHRYARWLEDIVRLYWPELSALMDREAKRTIDRRATGQMTIFRFKSAS